MRDLAEDLVRGCAVEVQITLVDWMDLFMLLSVMCFVVVAVDQLEGKTYRLCRALEQLSRTRGTLLVLTLDIQHLHPQQCGFPLGLCFGHAGGRVCIEG